RKAPPGAVRGLTDVLEPVLALAARELLAEGRQGLVGGEGAAGRGRLALLLRLAVGGGSRLAGLRLGLAGLLDLLAVGLVARLGLGVLPLPLLTLLVEALEPLPGLRVEALGVDVVALLVVGGRHAVERRVEL